jgi:hypothetical protein
MLVGYGFYCGTPPIWVAGLQTESSVDKEPHPKAYRIDKEVADGRISAWEKGLQKLTQSPHGHTQKHRIRKPHLASKQESKGEKEKEVKTFFRKEIGRTIRLRRLSSLSTENKGVGTPE